MMYDHCVVGDAGMGRSQHIRGIRSISMILHGSPFIHVASLQLVLDMSRHLHITLGTMVSSCVAVTLAITLQIGRTVRSVLKLGLYPNPNPHRLLIQRRLRVKFGCDNTSTSSYTQSTCERAPYAW